MVLLSLAAKEERVGFCSATARAAAEEEEWDGDDASVEGAATPFSRRR